MINTASWLNRWISSLYSQILFVAVFLLLPSQGRAELLSFTVSQKEVEPGDFLSAYILVKNSGELPCSYRVRVQTPAGCEWLARGENLSCDLDPGECEILLTGFRILADAPPGKHPLTLHLEEGGVRRETRTILLEVLALSEVSIELDRPPPYLVGQSYLALQHKICNQGNTPLPLCIDIRTDPCIPVTLLPRQLTLPPNSETSFSTHFSLQCATELGVHYVFLKVYHRETGELLEQTSFQFETLSSCNEIVDMAHRFPGHLSLYNLVDTGKWVGAVELVGGGPLYSNGYNQAHFFLRLPTDARRNIYNVDQVFFLALANPRGFVTFGDAVYALSPLTERYRYARGVGGRYFLYPFEFGGFYAQPIHQYHERYREVGASIAGWRCRRLRLGGNYLYKAKGHCPDASIGSLQIDWWSSEDFHAYLECGYNFGQKRANQRRHAVSGSLKGRILQTGWFSIEQNYAGALFLGYITNLDLTSASLDLPLGRGWRAGASANHLGQNRQDLRELCDLSTSLEQKQYSAHLSYHAPCNVNLVATGKTLRSKDLLEHCFDFRQYWAGLDLSWGSSTYSVLASFNLGHNEDLLQGNSYQYLQRYYLYCSQRLGEYLDGFLLGESGHIDYFDPTKWRNGISAGLRYVQGGNWVELSFQHAVNMPAYCSFNHILFSFTHLFTNRNELHFRTEYFRCRSAPQPEKFLCLLRYTIPFSLPISRKRDYGRFRGRLLHASTQRPVSYAVINVEGQRVATNREGYFAYTLPPGCYPLSVEAGEETPLYCEEQAISIQGGRTGQHTLYLHECGSIEGQVLLYDLPDTYEGQLRMLQGGAGRTMTCRGGVQGVRISVVNYEQGITLSTITDCAGYFSFRDLPYRRWVVVIEKRDLPEGYLVQSEEVVLEIAEGERVHYDFTCYPREYGLPLGRW